MGYSTLHRRCFLSNFVRQELPYAKAIVAFRGGKKNESLNEKGIALINRKAGRRRFRERRGGGPLSTHMICNGKQYAHKAAYFLSSFLHFL